ncbi:MAG: alpha/beta fold hydrolase [Saprospiraceae bacterium]|jgi:pimeloyl-ACP methyl ester carboxylesterase
MHRLLFAFLLCTVQAIANSGGNVPLSAKPELPLPVRCDSCRYPVVMVHGFLASGDTWASFQQMFAANGYSTGLLFVFDWNTLSPTSNHAVLLDAFIDQVLAKTGAAKVRLIGHSAGGGLGYSYLSDAGRAAKVDSYVHIGSMPQSGPAGPDGSVPTLNIWSADDKVARSGTIPGATNIQLNGADHYQVATSEAAFEAVWAFFHPQLSGTSAVDPEAVVNIAGKVLYFGENRPLANARVDIFQLDPVSGARLNAEPFQSLSSDSLGCWGPVRVDSSGVYEFVAASPDPGGRKVHYFREKFRHSNPLVYLRAIPPPASFAGFLLKGLPDTDSQAVLTVFSASRAVVYGRDSLIIAGKVVSDAGFASAEKTAIAWFFYDDGDNRTTLTPVGMFNDFPFLNGVDMCFPTAEEATIPLVFNGRVLNVRNIKSSDGIVVAVFN